MILPIVAIVPMEHHATEIRVTILDVSALVQVGMIVQIRNSIFYFFEVKLFY